MTQDRAREQDRDFIERKWREGVAEAKFDRRDEAEGWPPSSCPYEQSSLAGKWWTRGYFYEKAEAEKS